MKLPRSLNPVWAMSFSYLDLVSPIKRFEPFLKFGIVKIGWFY